MRATLPRDRAFTYREDAKGEAAVTFEEFVRANSTSLHATAWLLCGDVDDARDLVQSTLLVLFRRWDALRHDNLRGYAVTVMANQFRKNTRARGRRLRAEAAAARSDVFDVEYGDERDRLASYLRRLGPRQRAAVVLRVVADMSVADVADVLDCSPVTVRSQTARALRAMREAMAADTAMEEVTP